MSATISRFLLFFLFCSCLAPAVFSQEESSPEKKEKESARFAPRLADQFPLILNEGRLTFEFPAFESAQGVSEKVFSNSQGQSRTGFQRSSNRGNDQYSLETHSGTAKLLIASIENEARQLFLQNETVEIKRVALIQGDSKSSETEFLEKNKIFQCTHYDAENAAFFVLRQNKEAIQVVFTEGAVLENVEAASYVELTAHPRFETIFKLALSFGFRLPLSVTQEENLAILKELLTFTRTNWDEFMQEFADLQSDKFAEREEASRKLNGSLDQWKVAIIWGLSDENVAKETKARLLAAIKANPDSKTAIQISSATKNNLMENVPLMISLLSMQSEKSVEFRSKLVKRLGELTEESFGEDIEAWKKWSLEKEAEKNTREKTASSSSDAQKDTGRSNKKKIRQMDFVREELAQLMTLGISDDGKIEVDRKSWARLFGDKSVKELVAQVNEEFKKSGLPESWLDIGGGFDVSVANHSHLLFEKLQEAVENSRPKDERMEQVRMIIRQQQRARMNIGTATQDLNRQIQSQNIVISMLFHPENQQAPAVKAREDFFQFSVLDTTDDSSRVSLNQQADGGFSLLLIGRRLDPIVILGQSKDKKCWVNVLSRAGSFSARSDSASELFKKNQTEMNQLLFPILCENGINLNSALGGPLEIKNEKGRRKPQEELEKAR